jgi:hypothetical protein
LYSITARADARCSLSSGAPPAAAGRRARSLPAVDSDAIVGSDEPADNTGAFSTSSDAGGDGVVVEAPSSTIRPAHSLSLRSRSSLARRFSMRVERVGR